MKVAKGYKQTEVGVIPKDWKLRSLSDLSNDIGDGIHTTPKYVKQSDYFFVNGNNLEKGKINIDDATKCVSKHEYLRLNKKLNKQSVLLSINGTIGNCAFFNDEKIILGKSAAYINLKNDVNKFLILNLLQHSSIKNYFNNELTGTTIKNLSLKTLRNTPIPIPPSIEEQTAIANALSEADEFNSSLERLIAKKKNIKEAVIQKLLTPKKDWTVFQLDGICQLLKGSGLSKGKVAAEGSYKCILYGELFTTYLETIHEVKTFTDYTEGVLSKKGDILLPGSTTTTGIDLAKASALMLNNVQLGGDVLILRKKGDEYEPTFLSHLLTHIKKFEIAQRTKGITIHHLHGKDLKDLRIELPKIQEQQKTVQILNDIDKESEALQQQFSKYKLMKQGMMQNLLTGKVRLV